jgi:hypothetical protein
LRPAGRQRRDPSGLPTMRKAQPARSTGSDPPPGPPPPPPGGVPPREGPPDPPRGPPGPPRDPPGAPPGAPPGPPQGLTSGCCHSPRGPMTGRPRGPPPGAPQGQLRDPVPQLGALPREAARGDPFLLFKRKQQEVKHGETWCDRPLKRGKNTHKGLKWGPFWAPLQGAHPVRFWGGPPAPPIDHC